MAAHRIDRTVIGSVLGGGLGGLTLVAAGPLAGREEHVITGTLLLAWAAGWAAVAALAARRIGQPQPWAATLAAFMAVAGAALLLLAPGNAALNRLGWIWPLLLLALLARIAPQVRQHLRGRGSRSVVYPVLALYGLCAFGGLFQTIGETLDRRRAAPGQLVDVGGHRLHLECAGTGGPVVVLESGLGETAAYWKPIASALAGDTTVCAYDRAGRGWSEEAGLVQDGHAVASDLHALLGRAGMTGPFVLAGHSSGAQYARVFAGRYPEDVAGMVLLDGQPAEAFEGLPAYPAFYDRFRRIAALLPSIARVGVFRLVRADHVSARHYRSLRDEFAALPSSLAQARSFQNLGERPLVVVTAAAGAMAGWLPLQERMAALSSRSSHRVVPYAHNALVVDTTAAQTSIRAIRDVVNAVRSRAPLTQQQ